MTCRILVDDIDNSPLVTVYDPDTGLSAGAWDGDQLGDVLDSCPPEDTSLMMTLERFICLLCEYLVSQFSILCIEDKQVRLTLVQPASNQMTLILFITKIKSRYIGTRRSISGPDCMTKYVKRA